MGPSWLVEETMTLGLITNGKQIKSLGIKGSVSAHAGVKLARQEGSINRA